MTITLDITMGAAENQEAAPRPGRIATGFSFGILILVVAMVVFADFIAPYAPNSQTLDNAFASPTWAHLFGTDDLGRDIFSRMVHGGRTTVLASLLAVGIAVGLGLPIGLTAGYLGGRVDSLLMRVVDTLLAFPAIVLAIGITATMGVNIINAMVAVGIVLAPSIARLSRAQTMSVKESTYVEAARSFGARGVRRVVIPHILPNMIQPVVVQTAILMGYALLAEASLSFLQLGVQPPDPSWGAILSRAYGYMDQAPLTIFIPGIAIALTVFAFNIGGDEAQRRLDPRRIK